jgi:hypothetical protein
MTIKLEEIDVAKLKEMLIAKQEIYSQIKEMQHYAENFAIGIWQEQRKLEEKYNVDLSKGKSKLNLQTNEIEEESKIIS